MRSSNYGVHPAARPRLSLQLESLRARRVVSFMGVLGDLELSRMAATNVA
jgi:hypothetical protein